MEFRRSRQNPLKYSLAGADPHRVRRPEAPWLTTFVRRETWIYSSDLLTPSALSLLPHVDVIHSMATPRVQRWELVEL